MTARLFAPELANRYVWPAVSKTDRSNPRKLLYITTDKDDPEKLSFEGYDLAGPAQVGRYDSLGRYQTYLPPIDGIHGGLGRYVLHPLADQAITDHQTTRLHAA